MRLLELSSPLLLLLLLAYTPSPISADPSATSTDPSTTSTDPSTTSTDPSTTSTDPSTTSTDPSTTSTDPSTTSTDPSTTSTDPSTPSTEPSNPSTDPSNPSTEPSNPSTEPSNPSTATSSPTTTLAPVKVLEQTNDELEKIDEVLDKFTLLVNQETVKASAAANARRVRRSHGHPAAWWLREGAARPRANSAEFCESGTQDDSLCHQLESKITETNNLVLKLNSDVDAWKESDFQQLQQHRTDLDGIYEEAKNNPQEFTNDVITEEFNSEIDAVKTTVAEGTDAVKDKIAEINSSQNDSGGSVALVAVLGTLGGLMIVALVGTIGYKYYKQSKTKHPAPDGPYNKLEGESIPIGRLRQETPAPSQQAPRTNAYSQAPAPSQQAPRTNAYSQAPAPLPRREPSYASPYGPKSEASYGGRSESRYASSSTGGGLPRARL